MNAHFVYALKGWIRFRFDGADEAVTVVAGSCLSQPGDVTHNVIGQSHDLEIIEMFKASAADDRLGVPVRLDGDEICYAYPVAILAATRPA